MTHDTNTHNFYLSQTVASIKICKYGGTTKLKNVVEFLGKERELNPSFFMEK